MNQLLKRKQTGGETMTTETLNDSPGVWMEVKLVLEPKEYHLMRCLSLKKRQSVSELTQEIVRKFIEKEIKRP